MLIEGCSGTTDDGQITRHPCWPTCAFCLKASAKGRFDTGAMFTPETIVRLDCGVFLCNHISRVRLIRSRQIYSNVRKFRPHALMSRRCLVDLGSRVAGDAGQQKRDHLFDTFHGHARDAAFQPQQHNPVD